MVAKNLSFLPVLLMIFTLVASAQAPVLSKEAKLARRAAFVSGHDWMGKAARVEALRSESENLETRMNELEQLNLKDGTEKLDLEAKAKQKDNEKALQVAKAAQAQSAIAQLEEQETSLKEKRETALAEWKSTESSYEPQVTQRKTLKNEEDELKNSVRMLDNIYRSAVATLEKKTKEGEQVAKVLDKAKNDIPIYNTYLDGMNNRACITKLRMTGNFNGQGRLILDLSFSGNATLELVEGHQNARANVQLELTRSNNQMEVNTLSLGVGQSTKIVREPGDVCFLVERNGAEKTQVTFKKKKDGEIDIKLSEKRDGLVFRFERGPQNVEVAMELANDKAQGTAMQTSARMKLRTQIEQSEIILAELERKLPDLRAAVTTAKNAFDEEQRKSAAKSTELSKYISDNQGAWNAIKIAENIYIKAEGAYKANVAAQDTKTDEKNGYEEQARSYEKAAAAFRASAADIEEKIRIREEVTRPQIQRGMDRIRAQMELAQNLIEASYDTFDRNMIELKKYEPEIQASLGGGPVIESELTKLDSGQWRSAMQLFHPDVVSEIHTPEDLESLLYGTAFPVISKVQVVDEDKDGRIERGDFLLVEVEVTNLGSQSATPTNFKIELVKGPALVLTDGPFYDLIKEVPGRSRRLFRGIARVTVGTSTSTGSYKMAVRLYWGPENKMYGNQLTVSIPVQ